MAWTDAVFTIRKLKKRIEETEKSMDIWTLASSTNSSDTLKTILSTSDTPVSVTGTGKIVVGSFSANMSGEVTINSTLYVSNAGATSSNKVQLCWRIGSSGTGTALRSTNSTSGSNTNNSMSVTRGTTYQLYIEHLNNGDFTGYCTQLSVRGKINKTVYYTDTPVT